MSWHWPIERLPLDSRVREEFVAVDAWLRVTPCSKCGAQPGKYCRTIQGRHTGQATPAHRARMDLAWQHFQLNDKKPPKCPHCKARCGYPALACKEESSVKTCDHKFIGTIACTKCGWIP